MNEWVFEWKLESRLSHPSFFIGLKGCLPDFPSPGLSVPYPPSRDEQYIPQVTINHMTKTKKACLIGQPVPVITSVMVE